MEREAKSIWQLAMNGHTPLDRRSADRSSLLPSEGETTTPCRRQAYLSALTARTGQSASRRIS
jgi:hypothetical protein